MAFYIYIIKSEEGFHYIGQTENFPRRLEEHNSHLSHSTKYGNNWQLIYSEEYSTRSEAMKREKWLKSGSGREWIRNNIPGWSPPKAE